MDQSYDVGKVKAKNVAIGPHGKAGDRIYPDAEHAAALYRVRQLIELLAVHADEISSPHAIQAHAESVEAALQKKNPNRSRIENLIQKIAGAVAGVTALANAVDAVQAAVDHLFK